MSSIGMSAADLEKFAGMLDPQNGASAFAMQRPESQSVGYSLAEATPGQQQFQSQGEQPPPSGAAKNPGSIYVPASIRDKDVLPVPSTTKAGRELKKEKEKSKPKGNDIWSKEELDQTAGGWFAPNEVQLLQGKTSSSSSSLVPPVAKANSTESHSNEKEEVEKNASSSTVEHSQTASSEEITKKAESKQEEVSVPLPPAPATRKISVPEHEVLYKQKIGTEDMYLGVDFTRDNSTTDCEAIIVKVKMPLLASSADLDMDVEPLLLKLRSPDYLLSLPLPEKVVEKKGHAQWNAKDKVLLLTLTIDPETRKIKMLA